MGKTFRAYDMNQQLLLPPDLRQWLREDHLALYVSDVVEALDLSAIINKYEEGDERGRPPYHPALMIVKLLVYGYCTFLLLRGSWSKRLMTTSRFVFCPAISIPTTTALRIFASGICGNWRSLSVQVLRLCQQAGLVKLGHVAVDSTKIKANARKDESLRYKATWTPPLNKPCKRKYCGC